MMDRYDMRYHVPHEPTLRVELVTYIQSDPELERVRQIPDEIFTLEGSLWDLPAVVAWAVRLPEPAISRDVIRKLKAMRQLLDYIDEHEGAFEELHGTPPFTATLHEFTRRVPPECDAAIEAKLGIAPPATYAAVVQKLYELVQGGGGA